MLDSSVFPALKLTNWDATRELRNSQPQRLLGFVPIPIFVHCDSAGNEARRLLVRLAHHAGRKTHRVQLPHPSVPATVPAMTERQSERERQPTQFRKRARILATRTLSTNTRTELRKRERGSRMECLCRYGTCIDCASWIAVQCLPMRRNKTVMLSTGREITLKHATSTWLHAPQSLRNWS